MKSQLFCCALLFLSYAAADEVCTPDSEGVEPCPDLELTCVRDYFQNLVDCDVETEEGNALDLGPVKVNLPSFQMKAELEIEVDQLDGEIVAFTVNKQENMAVLAVTFHNVTADSVAAFTHYPTGKEPRVFTLTGKELYSDLTITTYFQLESVIEQDSDESSSTSSSSSEESSSSSTSEESSSSSSSSTAEESSSSSSSSSEEEGNVRPLDLATARHFASWNVNPVSEFGGDCLDTDDEVLSAVLADFHGTPYKGLKEAWVTRSRPVAEYYIQHNICKYKY